MSNKFSSECLHFFVCLFTFFVFVFSSLFKTFKELEKRLMHCEYHHCISASQSSEWFMICSNIFFDYNWHGPLSHLGPWLFRTPRNLVPSWESFYNIFMQGKLPGAQSSRGPKKPGSQMWLGTISVIAYFLSRAKSEHFCSSTLNSVHSKCKFNKASFNVFLTSNYSPNSNE